MELGLVAGVIGLGILHGVLPDHGWPIAATYALDKRRRWVHGVGAGLILGVGHLVSSVALVLAYFWLSTFAEFAEGPWMGVVAGSLLILLGINEYVNGGHGEHDHGGHEHDDHNHAEHDDNGHDHAEHDDNGHDHHAHDHDRHDDSDGSILDRARSVLPGGNGHQHLDEEHAQQGLFTLGSTALLLGFAHEEPIQILAICAGTAFCLELMLIYSLAVIGAILVPTLLLIAGYEHYRETVERYTPYLPTITAIVLVTMGLAFVVGFV